MTPTTLTTADSVPDPTVTTATRLSKNTAARTRYICTHCGSTNAKWVGRCGQCQAWGSVTESAPVSGSSGTVQAQAITEVSVAQAQTIPTNVSECDRVLGGGLVRGGVVLLTGEPGIGKSTLLLEASAKLAGNGCRVLYVCAEESTAQVRLRAERIGALHPHLFVAAVNNTDALAAQISGIKPDVFIVDSVQTMSSTAVEGSAGGVAQVREVAATIIRMAKGSGIGCIMVGHVTKDGAIAGPRTLEHLVDVVCSFEGDRHSRLRMLRAVKNRYGSCDEVGCFELTETGIVGLADPSGLFVSRREEPVGGTAVTVTVEGKRPLVAEVQALTGPTTAAQPRRSTSGLSGSRVSMIIAVLERRLGLRLSGNDIYTATVGGVLLREPATDLAVALAIASSTRDVTVIPHTIAIGEVGLTGEVRTVNSATQRLAEAARLGFQRAIIPHGVDLAATKEVTGSAMEVIQVADVRTAFAVATRSGTN